MIKAIIQAAMADLTKVNAVIDKVEVAASMTATGSPSPEPTTDSPATTSLVPFEPEDTPRNIEPRGDPFAVFRKLRALALDSTPTAPPSTPTPPSVREVRLPSCPRVTVLIRAH